MIIRYLDPWGEGMGFGIDLKARDGPLGFI